MNPNQDGSERVGMISKESKWQWYVIRTEPRSEHIASAELNRAGFEVFSPQIKKMETQNCRRDIPLFPGYLFIYCNLTDDMPTFKYVAPHVSGWVSFDGVIPVLPKEFIDELRGRVANIRESGGSWHRFQRGDKVHVITGQVDEMAKILEEPKSPQSRVRVLMEFMGRLVPAQVPWESLRPFDSEPTAGGHNSRRTRGKGRWIKNYS